MGHELTHGFDSHGMLPKEHTNNECLGVQC